MKGEGYCRVTNKACWANREGAEIMLAYYNEKYSDAELVAVYECEHCGTWHMTSKPQAVWVIEHRPTRFQRFCDRLRRSFEVWPV